MARGGPGRPGSRCLAAGEGDRERGVTTSGDPTLHRALEDLRPRPRVVTIGTFDGVHVGHQYLLRRAVARGRERDLPTLAVTFEPPPALVLRPDRFPGRLCPAAEKLARLAAAGLDAIVTLTFDRALAQQSAEQFMERLVGAGLVELWVGEGFALGKDRAGDVARLTAIGERLGFAVAVVPRLTLDEAVVSSSAIRRAVQQGAVATAWRMLGRPFRVTGEVIYGARLGRTIGFPTANIVPPPDLVPLADGIYASLATVPGLDAPRPSMTYVGTRPTVNPGARLVETHLLDFDGDLYGQLIAVDVLERLRGDATFDGLDPLVAQLRRDEAATRAYFARLDRADIPSPI